MKRYLLILLYTILLTIPINAIADEIHGKVVDAESYQPLKDVSIKVTSKQGYGTETNYCTTDSAGKFSIIIGKEGKVMMEFSLIGFRNTRKVNYSFSDSKTDSVDIGFVELKPTAIMTEEVQVSARMPRFTMNGDTIVFHPEAFRLPDGARLAELIRKLPGVKEKDGGLYWNDKPLRLMMNGKDIFGGNGLVTDLPAEVAGKIKLYNRKSELSRHTKKDDGTEDHVLDIQVKPNFLDKWYGYVQGSYVTKKRYDATLHASKLSDHDPAMLFSKINNRNMSMHVSPGMMRTSGISNFGKEQYGSLSFQHNWTPQGTKNFSTSKTWISGMMAHDDGWGDDYSSRQTFFPGEERTWSLSRYSHSQHGLTPQLQAEIKAYTDSANLILFHVDAVYNKLETNSENASANYSQNPYDFGSFPIDESLAASKGSELYNTIISRQKNYNAGRTDMGNISTSYSWTHYLGKNGQYGIGGKTIIKTGSERENNKREIDYLREGFADNLYQYKRHRL